MPSAFLTYEEISKYITEITTGLKPIKVRAVGLGNEEYIKTIMLRQPTSEEKRIAQLKHDEAEEKAIENGFRSIKEINKDFIGKHNIYTEEDVRKEGALKGQIEAIKLMYKTAVTREYKENYKGKIKKAEEEYFSFISKKSEYERFSVEAHAEVARLKYLTFCCALHLSDLSQYWPSPDDYKKESDSKLISDIMSHIGISLFGYPSDVIRALARSSQWRSIWSITAKTQASIFGMPVGVQRAGKSVFSGAVADFSNNQIQICSWSIFYDNLMQSAEPPADSVIEDDDLCDRYVQVQIEKQEKERIKNMGPKASAGDHADVIVFGDEKDFLFDPETGELRK